MAQVVRFQMPRSAMRTVAVVNVAGFPAVVLTPVGGPPAAAVTIPYAYVGNGRSRVNNTSSNKVVKTVRLGRGGPPTCE